MNQDLDALPLPDPLALLHTGDDFGGERDDPEIEFNGFNAATEFCLSKPAKTKVGLHTDDALRDYGQRCYELAMRKAQEGREQTTAQGKINAELDTDSNTSESQQRRHMAGSLEVGQLVGGRQDSCSGNLEPQGTQHVATLRGIDEYGPMLDWHKHWVDLPIGAKLLVAHAAQQPQGQAVSDEEIMQMSDAAGITFDDCGEHPPAVREDCCLKSRVTEFARAILALRDGPSVKESLTVEQRVPLSEDWATIAGLESAVGHLSTLVDQQRALLAESEDVFGRDGHGGRYEDGECNLIDRIRAHLEMTAPPQNGITEKDPGHG